ncbi:MAG: M28 family peptidase [Ignavibacteriae bacterium]|nr:M28 family peptidase [Ignavibacteriota bacterium]
MKKIIIIILFLFCSNCSNPQIIYSNKIDSIKNLVSTQSLMKFAKDLTGDTIAFIGGSHYRIFSRFYLSSSKLKAAQYIFEKFQNYGLNARYQQNDITCLNIIGTKTGYKYPNQYFIICAHYDAILVPMPTPTDTVPGADDNASGVCIVLEAARLLSNFSFPYSLIYATFDKEEAGFGGSIAYVDSIFNRGDTIRGVLNLDMTAWDGNNDNKYDVFTDSNSNKLAEQMIIATQIYQTGLIYRKVYSTTSDQASFINKNYKAILLIEDTFDTLNQNIHKKSDLVNTFNLQFFNKMAKTAITTFASWGSGNFARMDHTPLRSNYDTTQRLAEVYINYPNTLGTGINAPRLYYKNWSGNYYYVNSFSIYQNIYKFYIPGFPKGSKISYYIAAQDSTGTFVFTLPEGGGGLNPPGTNPPTQLFTYTIWNNISSESNSVPKPITGMLTLDTIKILTPGTVVDVNVNLNLTHTNDGNLWISLTKSNTVDLSKYNGQGGQNFTNTIFDDSANLSITQGTPPFTGRYRPQTPLLGLQGKELSGNWILKILDNGTGNTGTLLNWSLDIVYAPSVDINNISQEIPNKYYLYQNYPNPFNPNTFIKFQITKENNVNLKIFDILGREVATLLNNKMLPGIYEANWNASSFPSGIYFYKLISGEYTATKKMVLIK